MHGMALVHADGKRSSDPLPKRYETNLRCMLKPVQHVLAVNKACAYHTGEIFHTKVSNV